MEKYFDGEFFSAEDNAESWAWGFGALIFYHFVFGENILFCEIIFLVNLKTFLQLRESYEALFFQIAFICIKSSLNNIREREHSRKHAKLFNPFSECRS